MGVRYRSCSVSCVGGKAAIRMIGNGERSGFSGDGAIDKLPLPGCFGPPPKVSLYKLLILC